MRSEDEIPLLDFRDSGGLFLFGIPRVAMASGAVVAPARQARTDHAFGFGGDGGAE